MVMQTTKEDWISLKGTRVDQLAAANRRLAEAKDIIYHLLMEEAAFGSFSEEKQKQAIAFITTHTNPDSVLVRRDDLQFVIDDAEISWDVNQMDAMKVLERLHVALEEKP